MKDIKYEQVPANDHSRLNTQLIALGKELELAFADKGNPEKLRQLVNQGAPVDYRLDYGLPIRIESEYIVALYYLLQGDKGLAIYKQNALRAISQGVTGANDAEKLIWYTQSAEEFFRILNAPQANRETIPLNPGYVEFVKAHAVEGRANPYHTNGSLIVAAGLQDTDFVKELLQKNPVSSKENGAGVNFEGFFDCPAAAHSAILLDVKTLELLLQNGGVIGPKGVAGASLLHWVAVAARIDQTPERQAKALAVAKCLLAHGADPYCPNLFGLTAIDYATSELKVLLQQNIELTMQKNVRPRDYVYEMSVHYLPARCIQIAAELNIASHITDGGISFDRLMQSYVDYDQEAIKQLLEVLVARGIFKITHGRIFPTRLSQALLRNKDQLTVPPETWLKSYDILEYLENIDYENIFQTAVKTVITANSLTYVSANPDALLMELANGHLLARAIRFATHSGLMAILKSTPDHCTLEAWRNALIKLDSNYDRYDKGLKRLIGLLVRYQIVGYEPAGSRLTATSLTACLFKDNRESLAPAMAMIDRPWWGAAGYLISSLKKNSLAAFEAFNQQTFMSVYFKADSPFPAGMAAISCFEDQEVAEGIAKILDNVETIVDIGGGEAGLLYHLHAINPNKRYILFEKAPENVPYEQAVANMKTSIANRYQSTFCPEIVLGDFYKDEEHNIPRVPSALYVIKCTLHNISDRSKVIRVLKNVQAAMGSGSQFCLAERLVPEHCPGPHMNQSSNMLMLLLFKAKARVLQFYAEVLQESGHKTSNFQFAGNYMLMQTEQKVANKLLLEAEEKSQAELIQMWNHPQSPVVRSKEEMKLNTTCQQ